eukprot:scaffold48432_cov67-Phaeocystis_antarctica.AAC.3
MALGKFGRGGAASAVVGLIGDKRWTPPLAEPAPPAPPIPPGTSGTPAAPITHVPFVSRGEGGAGTLLKGPCP